MTKHIFGQGIYMIVVILIILFAGEYFLPEENEIIDGIPLSYNGYVRTGRRFDYEGNESNPKLYSTDVRKKLGPSRHFTILFTTFVFLHIVNEWNCRKLFDELNFLAGLESNPLSLLVRLVETVVQVIISQYGNLLFDIYPSGMTWYQWLICIAFSLGSLVVRLPILLVPDEGCLTVCASLTSLVRQ